MSENTEISWTDATFNPWIGCTKISPGCDRCYAEAWDARFDGGESHWGPGAPRRRTGQKNWNLPLRWEREAATFFAEHGRRRRVFCASLADVFDNEVDAAWRSDLFELIARTPSLDWLVLTKRIGNAKPMMEKARLDLLLRNTGAGWPLKNLWLGATIVNREEMLRDAPKLKAIRAAVRFWSCEPLLGQLGYIPGVMMPDWIIAGGESGAGARPMHLGWVRSLRDDCAANGVAFHFKQHGEYSNHMVDESGNIEPGLDMTRMSPKFLQEWLTSEGWKPVDPARSAGDMFQPGAIIAQRVGKHVAGRMLDGAEHNAFPVPRAIP